MSLLILKFVIHFMKTTVTSYAHTMYIQKAVEITAFTMNRDELIFFFYM